MTENIYCFNSDEPELGYIQPRNSPEWFDVLRKAAGDDYDPTAEYWQRLAQINGVELQ